MGGWPTQSGYGVRFEWGPAGAGRLAKGAACLVVVDVLSFTTAVSIAVGRGTRVLPFAWPERDPAAVEKAAAAYARKLGARLAVHRAAVTAASPWSLSPAHLRGAPFVARLVLPCPNGAAVSAAVPREVCLVAACLRNVTAVGDWISTHGYGTPEQPVAVIAGGERWPDGSLRPALEDLLGAGALISELNSRGAGPVSPEAAASKAAYEGTADVARAVAAGFSGRRLAAMGFIEDVAIAAEEDTCAVVPVRDGDGAFAPG